MPESAIALLVRLRTEFLLALALLTRVPVPARLLKEAPPLASAVWAFPPIGVLIGALGGGVYLVLGLLRVPAVLCGAWTLGVLLIVTGALHEDGLADTADGFGGGQDRERKLSIMRDSRIGTFGVLALLLSLALRGAAIWALGDPGAVFGALIASGALGRGAILIVLARLGPARTEGLAASLGNVAPSALAWGLGPSALVVLLAFPLIPALAAISVAALAGWLGAVSARRQIGGYTGDVLGATEQVAECAVLTALAAATG